MKKLYLIIINFLIIFPIYSFEIKENKIYDRYGNSIEIKEYKKMVVVDPAAVETIFMLNSEKNIAAIGKNEKSNIWPYEETEKLLSVGTASKPSFEKIIAAEPDLVILNNACFGMTGGLTALKIPFIFHDSSRDIDTILESIKIYGTLLGKEDEAEKLYNDNLEKLKKINEKERKNPLNLKGAIIYTVSPMISFSNNYLPGKVLTYMGVENIAGNATGNMPIISSEKILQEDIDFIIASNSIGTVDDLLKGNPILKETRAAKEENIIFFNASDFLRGSPRLFTDMELIYDKLSQIRDHKIKN